MKKILNINKHPFLHGYSHTASFMSIVANKVRFNLSDVSISGMKWECHGKTKVDFYCDAKNEEGKSVPTQKIPDGVVINNTDVEFFFNALKNPTLDSYYLYQPLVNIDAFSFRLNAMKEVYRWSFAGIDVSEFDKDNNYNYFRAAFEPLDVIRITGKQNGTDFSIALDNKYQHRHMKIEIKDMLTVLTSIDGVKWEKIYEKENDFDSSVARVGFSTWMGNDFFKDWFFSNFIQLHCSKDLSYYYDVKLNYYLGEILNYRYLDSNPWIDKFYIPRTYISANGIIEFVKYAIMENKYITLELNEKYVPNTWAYRDVNFEHESMIYGIDEESETLYLMGYNKNQTFETYTLSFEEFLSAYNNVTHSREISMLSFVIPQLELTFEKSNIISFCSEYYEGINSTYRANMIHDKIDWVFGIQIYDVLLNNIPLLKDKKIVYLIYEHKLIMKERVKYLRQKGLIENHEFDKLYDRIDQLEKIALLLLMQCIKYHKKPNVDRENGIHGTITQLRDKDTAFMAELIRCLSTDASQM